MKDRKLKIIAEGIAFTILLSPLLRPWYRRWGASDEEASLTNAEEISYSLTNE